jgi:hypothetical protein
MSEVQVRSASTAVARAVKARDFAAETAARRKLTEEKVAHVIERALASAPPLTETAHEVGRAAEACAQ